jgi:hypothetical protein
MSFAAAAVTTVVAWNSAVAVTSSPSVPNPLVFDDDGYVPVSSPAIGDLTSLFQFPGERDRDD